MEGKEKRDRDKAEFQEEDEKVRENCREAEEAERKEAERKKPQVRGRHRVETGGRRRKQKGGEMEKEGKARRRRSRRKKRERGAGEGWCVNCLTGMSNQSTKKSVLLLWIPGSHGQWRGPT